MTQLLEEETHLDAIGDGRYRREIEEGPFWGMATAHGGYLMALLLRAMEIESGDPTRHPRMLSQHFLGPIRPGAVEIEVRLERVGRGVTSLSARLYSRGEVAGLATALFTLEREGPDFLDELPPAVAPPEAPDADMLGFITPVHAHFDFHRRFGAEGAVPVEDGGWIVPREPGEWDHRLALVLSDLWVPAIVRHPERVCVTPSLHHVAHFGPHVRGDSSTAFLVRHQLSSGGHGLTDEDISLWSDDGRLLMRARQLRSVVPVDRALGS